MARRVYLRLRMAEIAGAELDRNEEAGVRLVDIGDAWVIEDLDYLRFPWLYSGETRTAVQIKMDFVVMPNGDPRVARVRYPKGQVDLKLVMNSYRNWIGAKLKEREKLKELLEVYSAR